MHAYYRQFRFLFALIVTLFLAADIQAQSVCPANMNVCIHRAPFALTGATISGGTYSGTGVSAGIFDPNTAGEGNHKITYNYTDGNNDPKSCNFYIYVYKTIVVGCALIYHTICPDATPVKLPLFCLDRGDAAYTVTGTGISNNYFDPAIAGVGEHFYTINTTDADGCSGSESGQMLVRPQATATVTCPSEKLVASSSESAFVLSGASSSSGLGSYSGTGVSSGVFNPAVAGNGVHKITYSGYDVYTGEEPYAIPCPNVCTFNVVVGVLPVTLTKLTASAKENNIRLDWKTAAESKFDRFEIERSLDARKNFMKIHQIGGSNAGNAYSFTDSKADKGVPVYYRLKMVDKDGSYAYSQITWALVETKDKLSVYPNPASREIRIGSSLEMIEVKLVNMAGNEVFSEKYAPAKNRLIILPELSNGIYLLQVKNAAGISAFSKVIIN